MKQLTLVSLYGHKPKPLAQLIGGCVKLISESPLRRVFEPYHPLQVHGTLVGMEKLVGYSDHFNANLWDETSKKTLMDFGQLLATLQRHLPITVQFGGFESTFKEFLSRNALPYVRSFQVQWDTNRFTLIGWPRPKAGFVPDPERKGFLKEPLLFQLREDMKRSCSIKHKFPNDNDLFLVIGKIVGLGNLSDTELAQIKAASSALESDVRYYLATQQVDIQIKVEEKGKDCSDDENEICIAQYEKETLDLDSTIAHRVNVGMSPGFISRLYRR